METQRLNLAQDFFPAPRFRRSSEGWRFSADVFYDKFVAKDLRQANRIVIKLDGITSYASSFFDEIVKHALEDSHISHAVKLELLTYLRFKPNGRSSAGMFEGASRRIQNRLDDWKRSAGKTGGMDVNH